MRKVAVLYGALKDLSRVHWSIVDKTFTSKYFVRMEVRNTKMDLCDVLAKAKPRRGETVLNAVELE